MSVTAIIAAAGSGERFGAGIPKALIQLGDKTLLEHAVASISAIVDQIIISAPAGFEKQISELVGAGVVVVTGGATRSQSVRAALSQVTGDYVLVHDAARALASSDLAGAVLAALKSGHDAVVPALRVVDTIKVVDADSFVISSLDRASLVGAQTPQGFKTSVLRAAHASGSNATDDGALIEVSGGRVKIIAGEERALKITTPADLHTALAYLGLDETYRSGIGVDAHAFASGRPLWLACLLWPEHDGVQGHSDGDVAAHAICDALFAASQLGDLGSNFGTDRPEYADASGAQMLKETLSIVSAAGYLISNVTVQIIGNHPKISARRAEAIAAISSALGGIPISLSATTTDGMGLTGEGKGIAAIASALVFKR